MEAVTKAWDTVDWERLQARVEAEVAALGVRQDDSDARKERLVGESNAYKDRTNKENRKLAIPLIKAFQNEFEGLLARSSAAESALIDICRSIINLPDPKSLLKSAEAWKSDAEKTQKAVEEREDLKRQLLKANNELEDFRGKDVKVRKLKDKLAKLESEQDTFIENAVSEVEKKAELELNSRLAELTEERDKMKEQHDILEKNLNTIESKNKEMQRKLEIAKMTVEQKDGLENEQLSIAMKDLTDANHKIVFLEERILQLETEAEKVNESKKAGNIEDIAALGSVLIQKDEAIQQLTNDVKRLESAHADDVAKWKSALSAMEKNNQALIAELNELKSTLDGRNDYEAIKNELRLLREIEFGAAAEANSESIERLGETVETLDRLLAEKNRRLQNENASLRVKAETFKGDDVMKAIISGSHSRVVDTVGKRIGAEEATAYRQKNTDGELLAKINEAKQRKMENDLKLEDPNIDVLTFLRKQKAKETFKEKTVAVTVIPTPTPTPPIAKQVTRLGTHTITTTALPPQSLLQRLTNSSALPKNDLRMDDDLKLSTVLNLKRFSSSVKPVEVKTAEELEAENETIEKMQKRIQVNIQTLNGKALNTTEIASHCKRLMIAYNIGQRLFAKVVMNQVVKSQGSLSELLSKPRHWSKLTDKGREAFRRIYGWISDDEAIDLLCSLSPRRVWPADQTVEHPKAETLVDLTSPSSLDGTEESKSPQPQFTIIKVQTPQQAPPPAPVPEPVIEPVVNLKSSPEIMHLRTTRWKHDDISKEKILSILQTELKKIEEETTEKVVSPSKPPPPASNRRNSASIPYEATTLPGKTRPTAVELVLKQRVAAGLGPLTQAQYDKYSSLDTEQLVRTIKEFLTVNSISQRQFGEHVLGLSQGSVSDLLARPKTWTQLTQKGREPFIRMQLFMDDVEEAAEDDDDKQPKISVCEEDSDLAKTLATLLGTVTQEGENGSSVGEDVHREKTPDFETITEIPSSSERGKLVKYIDASTGEEILDSQKIVSRVKEVLEEHGISPRVFGDEYLNCSPTMCADLMIRTKPFQLSRPTEKVMYFRMRNFLNDPSSIPNLIKKEEEKDTVRDKFDFIVKETPKPVKRKASSDLEDYDPSKKAFQRTVITDYQKDVLRFVFVNELHPTNEMIEQIATKLEMSLRTVQNWFHNHRTRSKAREKEGKIYSDALPNGIAVRSDTWKDDLQKMLDEAPALMKQWAPDYYPRTGSSVKSSTSVDSPTNNNNGAPIFPFDKPAPTSTVTATRKPNSGGQLDKALARMIRLAEGLRFEEQEAELVSFKEKSERNDRLIAQLESDLESAVQDMGITERRGTTDMLNDANPTISDASLVPILTSQRNRLHERVTALEEAVSLEKTKQLSVQNEVERVREENIRLCERIRFLQAPNRQSLNSVESGLANESTNRNKRLSMHDNTTLHISRAILSTPRSRTVFFSYLLILHALIMLVLYKFAFDQSVVRDAETECEYKFHQHMMDNHKDG
ncbi:hypothetical protein L3Y34_001730 [Caenorhabditis briggsae]|uniref:Homeobox protein cut-like n=1 Tax=Caenorhabditis briggsae TaxID=6238 RepID=A0AAE9IQ99_CAEBR|nr:hypothetical protein L3Y34_001730 [Caenorhabditis briggsae]